jgi:cleavage and polyadenylation specificity factor subunit 3
VFVYHSLSYVIPLVVHRLSDVEYTVVILCSILSCLCFQNYNLHVTKVVGKLARKPPSISSSVATKDQIISGVLVQSDFKYSLMAPDDLREYAGLTTTVVTCKQRLPIFAAGVDLIRWSLEGMFGGVVNLEDDDIDENEQVPTVKKQISQEDDDEYDPEKEIESSIVKAEEEGDDDEAIYGTKSKFTGRTFRVMDCVTVRCRRGYVELEWVGNIINDGIADATLAILANLESSPAAVKCTSFHSLPIHPYTHN